jgi:hypothetical protein
MRRKLNKNYLSKTLIGVAAVILMATPSIVQAQAVGTGQATATVMAVLAVISTSDLQFGNVLQGVQKTADKTVIAEAGVFQVTGAGGFEISMSLTLPPFLWNGAVGSEDRLLIAFSSTDADLDTTAAGTPAAHGAGAIVDQNPHNLPDTNLGGTDNILQIYLGGTVYPAVDQRAGSYAADIVLTVSYTGT